MEGGGKKKKSKTHKKKSQKSELSEQSEQRELTNAEMRAMWLAERRYWLDNKTDLGISEEDVAMIREQIQQLEQADREEEQMLREYAAQQMRSDAALAELVQLEKAEEERKEAEKLAEDKRVRDQVAANMGLLKNPSGRDKRELKRSMTDPFRDVKHSAAAETASEMAAKVSIAETKAKEKKEYKKLVDEALSESKKTVFDVGNKLLSSLGSLYAQRGIFVVDSVYRSKKKDYIIDLYIPTFDNGEEDYVTPASGSHYHIWRNEGGGVGAGIRLHFNIKGTAQVFSIEVDYNSRKIMNEVLNVSVRDDGVAVAGFSTHMPISNSLHYAPQQASNVIKILRDMSLIPEKTNIDDTVLQLAPYIEVLAKLYEFCVAAVEARRAPAASGKTRKRRRHRRTRRNKASQKRKTRARKSKNKSRNSKTQKR